MVVGAMPSSSASLRMLSARDPSRSISCSAVARMRSRLSGSPGRRRLRCAHIPPPSAAGLVPYCARGRNIRAHCIPRAPSRSPAFPAWSKGYPHPEVCGRRGKNRANFLLRSVLLRLRGGLARLGVRPRTVATGSLGRVPTGVSARSSGVGPSAGGRGWSGATSMGNVAALGLDAAEWGYIERLLARGLLPNLAALRARALSCRFENVVAYRSELPWTHFATGRDAADLGYWGTVAFDPASYRATATGALDAAPFWSDPGLRSLVFDVPHTVLRDDVKGTQVTAWGAHSPEYPRASRPFGVLGEVDARFGAHPAFANDSDPGWYSPEYVENLTTALRTGAHRRIDALEWLLGRDPSYDLVLA